MPYKNIEDLKRNKKEYAKKNKEKIKAYAKKWYAKHKNYFRLKQRGYYLAIRQKIIKFLGGKCVRCGYYKDQRVLCIDHVRDNGSEERQKISLGMPYYKHVLKEIEKGSKDYQCLCANCNLIKKIEKDSRRRKD